MIRLSHSKARLLIRVESLDGLSCVQMDIWMSLRAHVTMGILRLF